MGKLPVRGGRKAMGPCKKDCQAAEEPKKRAHSVPGMGFLLGK